MGIKVESSTDSAEDVLAAAGDKSEKAQETKSAPVPEKDEAEKDSEASDALENTDDADKGEESESDDDESVKDDEKPKKKNGFKKRIDKLSKKVSEKEAEVEYWRQQALKGQVPQDTDKKSESKKAEKPSDGKPKIDDFETYAEYSEALIDWKSEQREKQREAKLKEEAQKAEAIKSQQTFASKVQEFKKGIEDFDEVIAEADDIGELNQGLVEALKSSDLGPQLLYELAKDREELERINKLGPVAAARELGKFEAKIAALYQPSEKNEKKQTKAPPPLKPVGAKSTGKTYKSPEEMTFQEYKKWREAR